MFIGLCFCVAFTLQCKLRFRRSERRFSVTRTIPHTSFNANSVWTLSNTAFPSMGPKVLLGLFDADSGFSRSETQAISRSKRT